MLSKILNAQGDNVNKQIAPENSITEPVFVASHRRSGTHLTLDTLVANFDYFKLGFENFDSCTEADKRLFKTHLDGVLATGLVPDGSKIVYVVRDGRDALVSLYNYEKSYDADVQKQDFSNFIRSPNPYACSEEAKGMNRAEFWNFHVQSWLKQTAFPVKLVTFDGWKVTFEKKITELEEFLKLDAVDKPTSMVMKPKQFLLKKVLSKLGLSRNTAIQFRGGRSQVWKENFSKQDLEYFESQSRQTYAMVSNQLDSSFSL